MLTPFEPIGPAGPAFADGFRSTVKISLVTATYRCADVLGACLASIARQDASLLEHVVIDGASGDGTLALLEQSRARIATLVSEPDRGIYDALNKGLARASGDVVGLLHADDEFADAEVLARIAAAFADDAVEIVYGDLTYVDRADTARVIRYWRAGEYSSARLRRGWMPPHPTFYLRRSLLERIGGYDPTLSIAADYDFMLRALLAARGRVVYLPEVLVKMRVGGVSNRSLANIWRKSRQDLTIIRRHRLGGLGTLALKNLSKLGQFFSRPAVASGVS